MTSSGMGRHLGTGGPAATSCCWDSGQAAGADEVCGQPLFTQVMEPAGKLDILLKLAHVIVPTVG
jgi:hypothetical protein